MQKTKTNTTHININTKKQNNWKEYNQALINRGNVSIYISEAIADGASVVPYKTGAVGHPKEYADALILLVLTIRELFHLPLRQSLGLMQSLLGIMRVDIKLPDYSTLSRRMKTLNVPFRSEFRGTNIVMLIDSSGFKVFGEGEWKVRKHGYAYRRTWRETHIAVDWESRSIIGLVNTKSGVHDNTQLRPLLKQVMDRFGEHAVDTIIGDGAYDSKDNYLLGRRLGIEIIAPPPKNATEHINSDRRHYRFYDTPGWEERNAVIRHIEEYGLDGWQADNDYHRRSLVENTFYRLKTIFGGNLRSRREETQYAEQCIRASLINRFNAMGLPKYTADR